MIYDYNSIEAADRYKLMAQSVIPRPIAWIVTKNSQGVVNIAPFSYFTPLSSEPPSMVVSIGHRPDGTPKDTLANIRETKRCIVCLVSPEQLEPMHFSSKPLSSNESEAEKFDIALETVFEDYPPMVKESPVAFACTLLKEIDLEGSKTIPVILKIEAQYISDNCITDRKKLRLDCDLLARVGPGYAKLGEKIEAPVIPE